MLILKICTFKKKEVRKVVKIYPIWQNLVWFGDIPFKRQLYFCFNMGNLFKGKAAGQTGQVSLHTMRCFYLLSLTLSFIQSSSFFTFSFINTFLKLLCVIVSYPYRAVLVQFSNESLWQCQNITLSITTSLKEQYWHNQHWVWGEAICLSNQW